MLSLDFIKNDYQDSMTEAEKIEEAIAIEVLTGKLRPGSRIVEQDICDRYNISRTPVRQILYRLDGKGLIKLQPNRGAFVVGLTKEEVDDILYLRSLLLPQAVKWAIERMTREEYKVLSEIFAFMEFYTVTNDLDKMVRINRGFNAVIYDAARNKELEKTLQRYDFIIKYANADVAYPNNYLETVLEERRAIFNAFNPKNPSAGYEAAQIHAYKVMLRRK